MRKMRTMRMGRWNSLIPPVTNSSMDTAWRMKKKHSERSYHDLPSLPCLIVNKILIGKTMLCCACSPLCATKDVRAHP